MAGTINGGIDPQTYALANGGQADYGTGPVNYSFLNPTAVDPNTWASLANGSYVGMPMQSDVYGGANDVNAQTNKSPYLEGYIPNNMSSYVDPSVGTSAMALNGSIAQPGTFNTVGNGLLNSSGYEVARWNPGIDPTTGAPSSVAPGYLYANGKIVADPNSPGMYTGQNGLVSQYADANYWAQQHPATYLGAAQAAQAAQANSGPVAPAVANYGDLSGTPDYTPYQSQYTDEQLKAGIAPQQGSGYNGTSVGKINPWEIGMNSAQIAQSRAGQPIQASPITPAGMTSLYGGHIAQQTNYVNPQKNLAMSRQPAYAPPDPYASGWIREQANNFMLQNSTPAQRVSGNFGMTDAMNNFYNTPTAPLQQFTPAPAPIAAPRPVNDPFNFNRPPTQNLGFSS